MLKVLEAIHLGKAKPSAGGGGGTSDYSDLSNKPQINGTTLSGNKSSSDLGVADTSLSNLTAVGKEVVAAYPKGTQTITDASLYGYIKTMYDASTVTGTDYVLKPDATITGEKSVNITKKGIASGFTSTSYINTGYKFNPGNNTWEVRCKFTTPSTPITDDWITPFSNVTPDWSTDALLCPFILSYNNSSYWSLYSLVLSSDGTTRTTILDDFVSTGYFSTNTEYYLSCKWTGSSLVFSRYQNGSWVQFSTKSASVPLNMNIDQNIPIIFGNYRGNNGAEFRGSVDLSSFELYVNDELVYSPVNSLPFKKLATGSKVVDVSYKSTVDQLAQSSGSALYYIIDTSNETITQPQGDLFGFITQAMEKGA